jgi:catechol-2,3-dioxygenase
VNSAATVFVAAGSYHHLYCNVWRGEGILSEPEGRIGLRR